MLKAFFDIRLAAFFWNFVTPLLLSFAWLILSKQKDPGVKYSYSLFLDWDFMPHSSFIWHAIFFSLGFRNVLDNLVFCWFRDFDQRVITSFKHSLVPAGHLAFFFMMRVSFPRFNWWDSTIAQPRASQPHCCGHLTSCLCVLFVWALSFFAWSWRSTTKIWHRQPWQQICLKRQW